MENIKKHEWYGLRFGSWYNQKGRDMAEMMTPNNVDNFLAGAYEPIPLTEEWMQRLGFVRTVSIWELNEIQISTWFTFTFSKSPLLKVQELNYVHELQDLYHALTGQELELKAAE